MADGFRAEVSIDSNKEEYLKALDACAEKILIMIGLEAEAAAKPLCPVDTGLLRNSITFAIAGKPANITEYRADPGKGDGSGTYQGNSPAEDFYAVHLGSNVEYAMAQETGNFKDGPHAFLRPAINNNIDHFKTIAEEELKNASVDEET